MTRACDCGKQLDDHSDVRYTVRGINKWFCSVACVAVTDGGSGD